MPGRGASTRERILTAAAQVIDEKGLAHTTTKEIARAAGCSEAALYKHFRHKEELFLAVMHIRLRPLLVLLAELPAQAGTGSIRARLERLTPQLLDVYSKALPMGMALFAEPALLRRLREKLISTGGGPQKPNEVLADYFEAERGLGRIGAEAPTATVADMIIGACLQRAFLAAFMGRTMLSRSDEAFAADLVRTALHALTG